MQRWTEWGHPAERWSRAVDGRCSPKPAWLWKRVPHPVLERISSTMVHYQESDPAVWRACHQVKARRWFALLQSWAQGCTTQRCQLGAALAWQYKRYYCTIKYTERMSTTRGRKGACTLCSICLVHWINTKAMFTLKDHCSSKGILKACCRQEKLGWVRWKCTNISNTKYIDTWEGLCQGINRQVHN